MGILGRSSTLHSKKSSLSFNNWRCMVEVVGVVATWEGCFPILTPILSHLVNEVLPTLVTKTMENFVKMILVDYITCTIVFDLLMSQGSNDIFALVISFINALWQPCHVTIIESTMGTTMVEQMKDLLGSFELLNKVIGFVKDKGANLRTMTIILKNIISCDMLDLPTPFAGTCWGHVMSKAA